MLGTLRCAKAITNNQQRRCQLADILGFLSQAIKSFVKYEGEQLNKLLSFSVEEPAAQAQILKLFNSHS
jgi:hypothetical protein